MEEERVLQELAERIEHHLTILASFTATECGVTRLPFTVPDDILIRKYAKRFKNPFYDFSVPLATLQLKQAIGRVNRRKDQKSVVVILDKRLAGKTYAKKMVKNLRQASRVDFAKIEDILQETKDFL